MSPRRSKLTRALVGVVMATPLAVAAGAAAAPPDQFKATPLKVTDRVQAAKSAAGQAAKTDPALLGLRSDRPINVVVKLDYDSVAAYGGHLKGLPATSPAVTGRPLDRDATAVQRYTGFIREREREFLDELDAELPAATPGTRLRTVYGGMALRLPANQVGELVKLGGVLAVQADTPEKPLTDSSPQFIGAPTIYNQLGQTANDAGEGVIVGVLDTGGWPEHPSFADSGGLPAPPPTADGTPRVCDFGDNPTTPATDPFVCQNKLISGQPFLDTYNAVIGDDVYPDSARDSNGHGTHTASTAAGRRVANANPLGIDRGAIHGIAPGAHVAVYKVCGPQGCFPSDSANAVARAIRDRVDVINFSISGGAEPFTDVVELAFLDAYAAGIFVSASAGNSGPAAATVNHNSPWVTTVAASSQTRTFRSTITLNPGGVELSGASITAGVPSPHPVVPASAPPYNDRGCTSPAPPGLFTGKIVACEFGPGRVMRGFNVRQGGAAGMILYNTGPAEVMTDNHWLPTVHIAAPEAQRLLALVDANPTASASFTQGAAASWQGDRLASFSSRGPGGDWLKPDIAAPGLHVAAGATPTTDSPSEGPPGNLFQVISGTSMAAPHVAGSAALVAALHPDWSPGQLKSALETTATSRVRDSDGTTAADPFDVGGGRVDLTKAGDPGLTFDETAADYAASAVDPANRIDLNTPSINAPAMPGVITTTRTARNVTNRTLTFAAGAEDPPGTSISVSPALFVLRPGQSVDLRIRISAPAVPEGQYFGRIELDQVGGPRAVRLPVAFFKKQGAVTLSQTCDPTAIQMLTGRSTCTVTMHNSSLSATDVSAESTTDLNLPITGATGATRVNPHRATVTGTLAGREPDAPQIAPGSGPAPYIPLDAFGVESTPIGDEEALNVGTPPFVFAGQTYRRLGVTSNGYLVAGGADGGDVQLIPQTLPDPARPNGVLAPYWTDLDGTGAPGVLATVLTDGVNEWIVIEWRLHVFGTNSLKVFQAWIGANGTEDVTYTYDPANLPGAPPGGYGLTVGAENVEGTAGDQISGPPTEDLRVTSRPGSPGETRTYSYTVRGLLPGTGRARTDMTTPLVRGTTTEVDEITIGR